MFNNDQVDVILATLASGKFQEFYNTAGGKSREEVSSELLSMLNRQVEFFNIMAALAEVKG